VTVPAPVPAQRRRAVFLDVDGTYAFHGTVPDAHVRAVREARAAGHAVFLCTGRPVSLIGEELLAAGFDGVVASAGAYVMLGDEVIQDIRFPTELAREALRLLDEVGTHYLLETPEGTYARRDSYDLLAARAALSAEPGFEHLATLHDIVAAIDVQQSLSPVGIGKITAFDGPVAITDIARQLGPGVSVFPSSIADLGVGSGEIYLSHVDKAIGVEAAITALGIPREDAVAFGDNLNDLGMITYAGVGVAMADGKAEVIAAADVVVPGPGENGVAVGFAQLGLADAFAAS